MMRGNKYQYALILLGFVGTLLFLRFFYNEFFPEYKTYQDDYIALEKFRSTYTGEAPPAFKTGIKQLVMEREDKGPATVDRCITCHVALQLPHFSPTKIQKDINGKIVYNDQGEPVQVANEDYIWSRLDLEVQKLRSEGDHSAADKLESLKTATINGKTYDVTRVLRAHPLMGRETIPFQYHPIEEYGCVSCHNGNGRSVETERAHGPVFDGQYETEYRGFVPKFLEKDEKNDPEFARVFNDKPGHELLFQVNPLYVGSLIQAKCVQCHLTSSDQLNQATETTQDITRVRQKEIELIQTGYNLDKKALLSLLALKRSLIVDGYQKTLNAYESKLKDYSIPLPDLDAFQVQVSFLKNHPEDALKQVNDQIKALVGTVDTSKIDAKNLDSFIAENVKTAKEGALFQKATQISYEQAIIQHIQDINQSIEMGVLDQKNLNIISTDVDRLTQDYQRGKDLFVSQACYACHRIAGTSRGGVGPELTKEGNSYPWFVKESIVWPQADLKTSTMPNAKLDHDEVEALVTYLLAQKGENKALSGQNYKNKITRWESGKKQPWEEPIAPSQIHDLDFSMKVFAEEGCASCHRLVGYQSDIGFSIEKEKVPFDKLLLEKEWFKSLFPEDALGSKIAENVVKHGTEIDKRLSKVREGSILEKIEKENPGLIEAFYSNFKFAERAQNSDLKGQELEAYKKRLHNVLMVYIQEYGLGRLIGPRPNWSGVYRTDEWLMEHFKAPTSHIPRSIMPVLPFDETKFYALTYMLDVLGKKNRDLLKKRWEVQGFRPEIAYQLLCAQCHGEYELGNGPVSEWIYPIPKNLRKTDFMRNLTEDRVIYSLTYGVDGTPMPPWGVNASDKPTADGIPVLSKEEIQDLANWLYSSLPGGDTIRSSEEVPKWNYKPEDVIQDLKREGSEFKKKPDLSSIFPKARGFVAALSSSQTDEVDQIFEKVNSLPGDPDPFHYYIKREYYTPENIAAGKALFFENCAVCHGYEGDGAGIRAEAMYDAKPRMLTNLNWINFRDDLRLLRSIKYGVAGTSMVAWGDMTSSLQRLQLVIFIRTLTEAANLRNTLLTAIYNSFDRADMALEAGRQEEAIRLEKIQIAYQETRNKQKEFETTDPVKAVEEYQNVLKIQKDQARQDQIANLYIELKNSLKKERESYLSTGLQILLLQNSKPLLEAYLELVNSNQNKITLDNKKLVFKKPDLSDEKVKKILTLIQEQVTDYQRSLEIEKAKIASTQRDKSIRDLELKIVNLKKLEKNVQLTFEESKRESLKEEKVIEELNLGKKE